MTNILEIWGDDGGAPDNPPYTYVDYLIDQVRRCRELLDSSPAYSPRNFYASIARAELNAECMSFEAELDRIWDGEL